LPTSTARVMSRQIFYSGKFEKDLKKVKKQPKYNDKLFQSLINKIANGESLEPKYNDHKMVKHSAKGMNDCRDFHLAPNIVVIYRLTDTALELVRIGSHSDLFEELV